MAADQHFDKVKLLLGNDNQADGSTAFDDQSNSNHAVTANGNLQYDTAVAPPGMTSSILFDGADDFWTVPSHADFDFGSGDLTAEGMLNPLTVTGNHAVMEKRATGSSFRWLAVIHIGNSLRWWASSNGTSWDIANGLVIGTIAIGSHYHWAISRNGSAWASYLQGVAGAGATSAAALSFDTSALRGGVDASGLIDYSGHQAPIRITKGVGRYPTDFTPPSLPFPTTAEEPVVEVADTAGTGGRAARRKDFRWSLTVDGEIMVFSSIDSLIAFLDSREKVQISRAKTRAKKDARRILMVGREKANPLPPRVRIESAVAEIRDYVADVQAKVDRLYWKALAEALARDAEEEEDIMFIAGIL